MTIPGILAVDRAGRRNLMIYGGAGMFVSQLIVAILGTIYGDSNVVAQVSHSARLSILLMTYC